ncbi:uncharacterized protein LOC123561272 isoform X2 [Mercenaria mercenaria]|uniref:uncharacterized protein LOC123561272 isoform X2 n=1 Tax=Mercenaria mercenaria TaxID=6596 RepID=UPI00234E41B6|nr:uncharacterized protein LOC123561272 isoform X2 [Mercenaria mercenaria]
MNDLQESKSLLDNFCISLSNEQLMSLSESTESDAKLKVLSGWMSAFDSCASSFGVLKKETWRSCVFNFLKSCLTVDQNRYVIYTARKVITSLIKVYKSEDGITLLQNILNWDDHLELICTGLQICKELFSRKNLDHEFMVSQLGSSVTKAWQILSKESRTSVTYNQCLLEYFSVCIKLAKIVWSNAEAGESVIILQQILNHGENLNKILFDSSIKQYVKKKLKFFLCFILRPCNLSDIKVLHSEIFGVSVSIFNRLWSSDIISILRRNGKTTFIGNSSSDLGVSDDSLSYDTIHMRGWTFLCLCISSCLVLQQDYRDKAVVFLLRLDDCAKELLDKQTSSLFLWLPDIFGDQDDMWIDAMILLMEIFPLRKEQLIKESMLREDVWSQHHLHFLQFVEMLGYDHLVLIDLLTSPETNCLMYLLKYFKYLLATWEYFKTIASKYLKQNLVLGDCTDVATADKDTVTDRTKDIQVSDKDSSQKSSLNEKSDVIQENITSAKSCESEYQNVTVTNGMSCSRLGKGNLVSDNVYRKQLLASSSLMLISDAYDEDDDDNDYETVEEGGLKMEMNTVIGNEINADNIKPYSGKSKPVIESDLGKRALIEQDIDISCEENDNISDNTKRSREYNTGSSENNDKILCHFKERHTIDDKKVGDLDMDAADSVAGESVLDTVMGMLIRTRMKLEKLTDSHLMKYNPTVLINLIASVEELYEED